LAGVRKTVDDIQHWAIKHGDRFPIVNAGGAYVMHKYKKYSGKTLTSKVIAEAKDGNMDPHFERAINDWTLQSEGTQQSMRESNVSKLRGESSLGRAANMFTSGPAQIWRIEQDAYRKMAKGKRIGNNAMITNGAKQLAVAHLVSGLLFGLANNRFKWDKKEMKWYLMMGSFNGVAYLGRFSTFLKDAVQGKPWAESIPSIVPVLEQVNDITQSFIKIGKQITAEEQDEDVIRNSRKDLLEALGNMYGYGVSGAFNMIEGAERGGEKIKEMEEEGVSAGKVVGTAADILGITNAYTSDEPRMQTDQLSAAADMLIGREQKDNGEWVVTFKPDHLMGLINDNEWDAKVDPTEVVRKKITEHDRMVSNLNKREYDKIADDEEALMMEINKAIDEDRFESAKAIQSILKDKYKKDALKELRKEQADAFKLWLDAREEERSWMNEKN